MYFSCDELVVLNLCRAIFRRAFARWQHRLHLSTRQTATVSRRCEARRGRVVVVASREYFFRRQLFQRERCRHLLPNPPSRIALLQVLAPALVGVEGLVFGARVQDAAGVLRGRLVGLVPAVGSGLCLGRLVEGHVEAHEGAAESVAGGETVFVHDAGQFADDLTRVDYVHVLDERLVR